MQVRQCAHFLKASHPPTRLPSLPSCHLCPFVSSPSPLVTFQAVAHGDANLAIDDFLSKAFSEAAT